MYEEYFAETNEDHYRKSQLVLMQRSIGIGYPTSMDTSITQLLKEQGRRGVDILLRVRGLRSLL